MKMTKAKDMNLKRHLFLLVALATVCTVFEAPTVANAATTAPLDTFKASLNVLLNGVAGRSYPRSAYASTYVIWGERGFPVALSDEEPTRPVVAAVQLPSGSRLVAFGHEGIVTGCCTTGDEWDTLVLNSFQWLATSRSSQPTAIRIGTAIGGGNQDSLSQALASKTRAAVTVTPVNLDEFAAGGWTSYDVLWIDTYNEYSSTQVQGILKFANQTGKGIMVAGHAWYWGYFHPGANLFTEKSVNKILWPLGLLLTTDARYGFKPAPLTPPEDWLWYNTYNILSTAINNPQSTSLQVNPQVRSTVKLLMDYLPARSQSTASGLNRVWWMLDQIRSSNTSTPAVIGPNSPFNPGSASFKQWLQVYLEVWAIRRGEVTSLKASPSAAAYPGAVPATANTTAATITVSGTYNPPAYHYGYAGWGSPVWRSTGFYAPPGKIVTVTVVTTTAIGKGLRVQIGAHTDDLTGKDTWYRVPYVVNSFALNSTTVSIGNPMGGLIFVLVPGGTNLGNVQIRLSGAVQAPYFKLGQNATQWASTVRNYPAPWAELDSGKFVIMLPSAAIRSLPDPTPILKHWNVVMDNMAYLANMSTIRARAERFLVDADIGGGWMHSGYPVMAYDVPDVWNEMLDLTQLKSKGAWGPYHELGHNHQWSDMMFSGGCVESFNNLFTVYALEKTGVPQTSWENWGNVSPSARAAARADYLAAGANWARDWGVWIALDTYLQLKDGFGWTFYRKIYAAYQQMQYPLPEDTTQTWIQTTCKVAGYNLVPFYSKWGFPVGYSSVNVCGALPRWTADPMNPTSSG